MIDIKLDEYSLLNEIAEDFKVTQANLSDCLGIAVSSVNWYIKHLINHGWDKVSHLQRTRLKDGLTTAGMKVFTQRNMLYTRDSLIVYGDDEVINFLHLTCFEADGTGYRRKV